MRIGEERSVGSDAPPAVRGLRIKVRRFALVFLAAGGMLLALESLRQNREAAAMYQELEWTLSNVVERVRVSEDWLRTASDLSDSACLVKARAWARLVDADPSCLADQARLERLRQLLDVDEVAVTDERGVLTFAAPSDVIGFDFRTSEQSAEFLPAITNREFELAQRPQQRGSSDDLYQYVGVARRDRPGVAQVGLGQARLQALRALVASEDIARTSRVRRGGMVKIEPNDFAEAAVAQGEGQQLSRSRVYGGRRITVSIPRPSMALSGKATLVLLALAAVLLLMALLRVIVADLRRERWAQVRACLVVGLAALVLALAFESVRERSQAGSLREQLLLSLENVTSRIRSTVASAQAATVLSERANLIKARAFSLLLRAEPGLLSDFDRLGAIRTALDVDDVIATDEHGNVTVAVPIRRRQYNLAWSPDSAAFLPAVTNAAFEMVRGPFKRGFDGQSFQYAVVSRPDRPGVLALGFAERRLAPSLVLAALDQLNVAPSAESPAFVEVEGPSPVDESRPQGYFVQEREGREYLCLTDRTEGRYVTVGLRLSGMMLDGPVVSRLLIALAVLLFLAVLATLVPELLAASVEHLKVIFAFFVGLRQWRQETAAQSWRRRLVRALFSPIVLVGAVAYLLGVCGLWALYTAEAWEEAREELKARVVAEATATSDLVDNMLFAIARAIVRHYREPMSLGLADAADLAHRYDIDEVSVINGQGIAFRTNFGYDNFEMASCEESAKFNCLLHGEESYVQPFRSAVDDASVVRKYAGVPFPAAPGYVQLGIDHSRLLNELRYLFTDGIRGKTVGERGFFFWTYAPTREIVANGSAEARPDDTPAGIGFNAATAAAADEPFEAEFYGRRCLVVWHPFAEMRLYAVLPCEEISGAGKLLWPSVLLLGFIVVFAFLGVRLTELVTQLKRFIVSEQERQRSDMTMARTIQTSALPVGFPRERDFRIFARMVTAREVGGDFYDFYTLPDGRIAFLVADVSGKGVPAALFMMRAKAILRSAMFECGGHLAEALRTANDNLSDHNEAEMFVTAWVGAYDRKTGEVEYVSAGHNPPLIKRADGSVEWLRSRGGLVLAAVEGVPYRAHRCRLEPGDSLFLYTDGVTEAMNPVSEQYGEQRLEAALKAAGEKFVAEVGDDVTAFAAGAEQSDDITMLAFDRLVE